MEIKFNIEESDFEKFKQILNIEDKKINDLAKTAFFEYFNMITKSGIPNNITDVYKNRILLLINNYFESFPTEKEIENIFNITNTKSCSLLKNLKSTHRNELHEKLNDCICNFLRTGEKDINDDNIMEFTNTSNIIINELNEIISENKPGFAKFKTKTNSAGQVSLELDSYKFLCEYLNISQE